MTGPSQLTLDLPHRPALGRDDFLVAPSNAEAVAWLDRWPDWPATALALHGPPGSGKSHLAQVWRHRSGALEAAAGGAVDPPALATAGAVVVDLGDAEAPREERPVLHLYNLLAERRGHLLLVGREPPARWPLALADLRSRLSTAPAVALLPPDDDLRAAVMVKLFADRQIRAEAEVVSYLLQRLDRSFAAIGAVVAALDETALAERRPITVPLARAVLARLVPSEQET
ncbi:MAG: DNA replication protein [Alphaproteobacteria bacterium]|nr:DNA replication protein [Alphaproteobacteria bacterium]